MMEDTEKIGPDVAVTSRSGSGDLAEKPTLEKKTTFRSIVESYLKQDGGEVVVMPAPTRDPRDPMNIKFWHKVLGLGCLSFFGALIASAELILGAALPVFAIQYAGIDPSSFLPALADTQGGFPAGSNPLAALEYLGGPPIFKIYFLATMPLLVISVANLFLVPLGISIGRRPVILLAGLVAIAGASWAGESNSLDTHIIARSLQAIGAGSVESLIPFIIQDIVPVHQRNTWISAAFACQGVIIIAIGFSAPYMIVNLSWRWIYHSTAIAASFFLIGVFIFLPETRWYRTRAEMDGVPRDDADVHYPPRTWRTNLSLYSGTQFRKGGQALLDTCATFFYPSIFFVTILNGAVIAGGFAAGFSAAPALLVQPWSWPFQNIGLCLIPILIAAGFVVLVTGPIADWTANLAAKSRGRRVPENQLINLALPWACSMLGTLLFGLSGGNQSKYHWMVFLLSLAFTTFGFLGVSTITTVYVLESYPHIAGPVLVNVATFRWLIAFFLIFWASDWIVDWGYLPTFSVYLGIIAFSGLMMPFVYVFGPTWRKRFTANHLADRNYGI